MKPLLPAIPPILSATDKTPAYIVQAEPNEFYTVRLGSLIRGRSTSRDVEAIFGRPQNIERQSDGVLTYYGIQVYNPFEDLGGRR